MRQVSTPSRCAEPLQPCTAVDFDVDDDESHVVWSPATGLEIFDLHTIPKPTVAVLLMSSDYLGSIVFALVQCH